MSRSGVYRHKKKEKKSEEQEIEKEVINCFKKHRGNYGRKRIKKAMERKGIKISENKIARILRENEMKAKAGRRRKKKEVKTEEKYISENKIINKKEATKLNEIWNSDITEMKYKRGRLYICGIIDMYSRKIIGWTIEKHQRQEIVQEAIKMAIGRTKREGKTIYHSDRGSQFTAKKTKEILEKEGLIISMSRPGKPSDNQAIESFWKTLKQEIEEIKNKEYEEAKRTIVKYIEIYYNAERIHSSIGYQTPNEMWEKESA